MLKTSGFQVRSYASGADLLKDAKSFEPGCILLDIRMPGMDGLEVQQALKAAGVSLPVIIMTGHGDVPLSVKAMKAGAVDFLEKPFAKQTLLSSIDEAFRRLSQKEATGERRADAESIKHEIESQQDTPGFRARIRARRAQLVKS